MSLNQDRPFVTTGILLLLFSGFFGMTFALLGTSIHWPMSLSDDPATAFPLIADNHVWVVLGYYSFIVTSLLLVPAAMFVRKTMGWERNPWADVAVAFAVLAAVFRVLGIFRWLFLMPGLAGEYLSPQASASSKETIELIYRAFSWYADGFGTHLGDQLFTGIWIGIVGVLLLKNRRTGWLGWLGIGVFMAQVLACATDFLFSPNPFLSVVQSTVYLWVTLFGVLMLSRRRAFEEPHN